MDKSVWVKDKSNGRILKCDEGPDAYFPLVIDGQPAWRGHISKQHAEILPDTFAEGRKQTRARGKEVNRKAWAAVVEELNEHIAYHDRLEEKAEDEDKEEARSYHHNYILGLMQSRDVVEQAMKGE